MHLGGERREARTAPLLPAGEPAGDPPEAWPPERARFGIVFKRSKMLAADVDERGGRIGGERRCEVFGEIAQRGMDDDAAIGRARRQIDGIELAQLEDVLGVDRIRIAQPVLDVGHREPGRPRGARGLWHGFFDPLDLRGSIERARPGEISRSSRADLLPALFACDRRQALDEARGDAWCTGQFGGISEDHLVRAERLRKVMGGERNAPLRQIEPERVAHGAAQPRIGCDFGRPCALDQGAEHHAIGALQPRFQRTIDVEPHAR